MTDLDDILAAVPMTVDVLHRRPVAVDGIRSIDGAGPTHLTFARGKHVAAAAGSEAAVIVTDADAATLAGFPNFAATVWVLTENPRLFVAHAAGLFDRPRPQGIHPSAVVDPTAQLGADVAVGPLSSIGAGARIGDGTWIGPGVHVYRDAVIGERCVLHGGVIIGGDGFGFERDGEQWVKIPHLGTVIIGDDVEIGANSCVDRGTFGDTVLEDGVKLDNLVHVAHNVRVGTGTVLTANTMVAGSTVIGPGVWSGPSTSFMNGITVGAGAFTGLGAVVIKDVEPGQVVAGVPAKPIEKRK